MLVKAGAQLLVLPIEVVKNYFDDKEGRSYFYARSVMPESFILTPKNAPKWANDRQKLWNEVEKKDRKANSRYAKEFNVALPVEIGRAHV